MADLIHLSADALAQKLAAKEVSAVEATQAYLDRIDAVDGAINAFLHVNTEEALLVAAHHEDRGARLPQLGDQA